MWRKARVTLEWPDVGVKEVVKVGREKMKTEKEMEEKTGMLQVRGD